MKRNAGCWSVLGMALLGIAGFFGYALFTGNTFSAELDGPVLGVALVIGAMGMLFWANGRSLAHAGDLSRERMVAIRERRPGGEDQSWGYSVGDDHIVVVSGGQTWQENGRIITDNSQSVLIYDGYNILAAGQANPGNGAPCIWPSSDGCYHIPGLGPLSMDDCSGDQVMAPEFFDQYKGGW